VGSSATIIGVDFKPTHIMNSPSRIIFAIQHGTAIAAFTDLVYELSKAWSEIDKETNISDHSHSIDQPEATLATELQVSLSMAARECEFGHLLAPNHILDLLSFGPV
jgi:hypothetical protein